MYNRKVFPILVLLCITILATTLYFPFLGNGLVFDDHGLFTSMMVYDSAQLPFNLQPRTFPYFTLGLIHVLSGSIEVNRIFSITLHLACAFTLFLLLRDLLQQAIRESNFQHIDIGPDPARAQLLAGLCACIFTIHPIAVYGVAYLAQRTILFATLFSLLSLWFYRRAFEKNRVADLFTAALFYSMAIFSKQHAIMLPLTGIFLTALYQRNFGSIYKRISLYLVLCFPAAWLVLSMTTQVVATSYEPSVGAMVAQMNKAVVLQHETAILDQPWGRWLVSILMQAGFFFDYFFYWIVPDVRVLSADMRFDFVDIWFSWTTYLKAILFFLSPLIAIYFLRKKGLIALFCCGFLYSWFLFLTELAAVRFQEPFVLYRSYLWAPGYFIMLVAVCAHFSSRWLMIAATPLLIICFLLARDRLHSFSDESALWKDAAQKLTSTELVGSDRIFYNRGNAYLAEKKYAEAIADYSLMIQRNPTFPYAYYNRGLAYSFLKQNKEALADVDYSLSLDPNNAAAMYARGFILEEQGCFEQARNAYATSLALGNRIAKLKLGDLDKKSATHKSVKQGTEIGACPD
ncbi:tetratricopeptide repeat protein [Herminiimonas contaminans]|uniref:Tetratricopeptide repeat protein n=1 Tax=Herminiimonas contaminans TaxID=1111140 RepID=A0ABS0EN41_9BURK|nr:tetratricopeptide repeat protein [Herminiimonas contaminans]MBF8176271.1 tetratricopeptide repeat protein [Herminiimonas contaminans]